MTQKLIIKRGVRIASPYRVQHGDVELRESGGIVQGSRVNDTLDLLLRKGTITGPQHDNARRWYADYYVTLRPLGAIDYAREHGAPVSGAEHTARAEIRYKRALRLMPFNSPVLPVTTGVCLEGMSLRQAASVVRKDRTLVREALLCGLEILEEVYG